MPQTPPVQLCEQHWDAPVHPWPLGAQLEPGTQLPPEHAPEQHWPSPMQGISSAVQLPAPQTPLGQSWSQHSAGSAHGLPLGVHTDPPPVPPALLLDVPTPLLVALDSPVPAAMLALDEPPPEAEDPPALPQPLPRVNAAAASPEASAKVTRRQGDASTDIRFSEARRGVLQGSEPGANVAQDIQLPGWAHPLVRRAGGVAGRSRASRSTGAAHPLREMAG
jgi:hypothetical protein